MALVVITLAYGVVLALDSAPTMTLVTEIVADEHVGTGLSVQSLAGFSTTVVSPFVFGFALDQAGYAVAFPTLAAGALFGLLSVGALVFVDSRNNDGTTDTLVVLGLIAPPSIRMGWNEVTPFQRVRRRRLTPLIGRRSRRRPGYYCWQLPRHRHRPGPPD